MRNISLKNLSQWKRILAGIMAVIGFAPCVPCQSLPADFSETYRRVQDAVVTLTVKLTPGTQEQKLGQETAELVKFLKQFSDTLSKDKFQRISVVDFWETWYERFNAIQASFIETVARRGSVGAYRSMGLVVREDGLVLTNNAAILSGTNVLTIELFGADQTVYSATVCAVDPITNIALVQAYGAHFDVVISITPPRNLPPPGAPIFSIQHCYTLRQTTPVPGTMGNSGIGGYGYQLGMERAVHEEYFQAIMPLYHDSEGAPIFDRDGSLVGLLAREYRVAHYPGVIFAVPAWMIADVVPDLIQYGKKHRGALGISIDRPTLMVTEVYEGQAAARAGIQPGDIIESFNGSPIRNIVDLYYQIFRTRPNENIQIRVRRNNQIHQIEVRMDRFDPTLGS